MRALFPCLSYEDLSLASTNETKILEAKLTSPVYNHRIEISVQMGLSLEIKLFICLINDMPSAFSLPKHLLESSDQGGVNQRKSSCSGCLPFTRGLDYVSSSQGFLLKM